MKGKLAAVAVALLLFATGAAMAMPGNAPDAAQADDHSQADDHRPDDAGANATDAEESDDEGDEGMSENASDAAQGPPMDVPAQAADEASGSQGPPVDLPDAVPDFVSQIHEAIDDHAGGSGLGDLISDLTPGEDSESDVAESGDEGDVAGNATDAMPAGAPAGL